MPSLFTSKQTQRMSATKADASARQLDSFSAPAITSEEEQSRIAASILTLGTISIQHFEQRELPADYHSKRRNNKPKPRNPFPPRRILQRLRVMPTELEGENGAVVGRPESPRPRVLRTGQFQVLYEAIATSSGWWPLADERWNWIPYFARLEKYVLYLDDMPIGFGALERNSGSQNVTRIVFVGVIPSMQGYRFGNYLFNFINHLARAGDTEKVVLNTAPEFDTMKGAGKPEQSAAKMYLASKFQLVRTEVVDARQMALRGEKLESLNLPGYYKNHPAFTREILVRRLCQEFGCRQPHLPGKAKSR